MFAVMLCGLLLQPVIPSADRAVALFRTRASPKQTLRQTKLPWRPTASVPNLNPITPAAKPNNREFPAGASFPSCPFPFLRSQTFTNPHIIPGFVICAISTHRFVHHSNGLQYFASEGAFCQRKTDKIKTLVQ